MIHIYRFIIGICLIAIVLGIGFIYTQHEGHSTLLAFIIGAYFLGWVALQIYKE